MNRNKLVELNVVDYLSSEIDTNRDGIIDKNEQRTLAALISTDPITQQDVDAIEARMCCLFSLLASILASW